MTRFSDNIFSGRGQRGVNKLESASSMVMQQTAFVSAGAGVNVIVSGTFPTGVQNLRASVTVVQAGAATTNDNITVYVSGATSGTKLLSFLAIGSAANTVYTAPTYVTSACASLSVTQEVPFQIVVSSVSTASYQIQLSFSRIYGPAGGTTYQV